MLVIAWCAHVGSSLASSSSRTRRAALRAAVARSFIVEAGTKLRMRSFMASVMPTSRRSAAVSRSGSLNACAPPLKSCPGAWASRAPSPSSCRWRRGGRAAGQGTRSAATRRRRR
eukprot:5801664-Pleurochrysis_carterae.AAC.1